MISDGTEITKQQFIEQGKTLKEIAVGESESKTRDFKRKEENEEGDVDADEENAGQKGADEEDGEEYGDDYSPE